MNKRVMARHQMACHNLHHK